MQIRRGRRSLWVVVPLFFLGPGLHPATAQLLGPEFQVNSYTTDQQGGGAVAEDGAGNFVVVWQSEDQDGSGQGVFAQRFSSAGGQVGGEFRVNAYTTGYQVFPAMAADGAGNFVVVWQREQASSSWGVVGQRFNAAGSPLGSEFQVNSYTTADKKDAAVAMDGSGNFVVVWTSYGQDGSFDGVFAQRYDPAGDPVGSEFPVNSYTPYNQSNPAAAADGSGNFVVVWASDGPDGSSTGVSGQRFNSAGNPVGSEFQVNTYTTNLQRAPAVAMDAPGNFVVAWNSYNQDVSQWGVFGQRYDLVGTPVGSEFQVNTFATGNQAGPAVAVDSSGGCVVVWGSSGQDGAAYGVFGQRFDSAGSRVASEFLVNSYTTGNEGGPAVAAGGSGNFVVTWGSPQDGSYYGVVGRQMTIAIFSDGFEASDVCAWSAAVGSGDNCPP